MEIKVRKLLLVLTLLSLSGCVKARHYFVMPPDIHPDVVCDPPPLHPDVAIGSNWCKKQ